MLLAAYITHTGTAAQQHYMHTDIYTCGSYGGSSLPPAYYCCCCYVRGRIPIGGLSARKVRESKHIVGLHGG